MSKWRREFLKYEFLALVLTLLAFAVRAIALEDRPLTIDEFGAAKTAALHSTAYIATNYHTTNHVLAQILARWTGVVDYSLFFLRLPSLWAGVLSVALLYKLGRFLIGPREGLLAALLLALIPIHIGYSQEVRGYAALVLGTLTLFYCLWRILERDGWRYWLGFGLAAVLTPYAHLFGAVPVGITGLLLGYHLWRSGRWRERALWRKLLLSSALIVVGGLFLFTPLLLDVLQVLQGSEWSGDIAPLLAGGEIQGAALRDYAHAYLALSPDGDFETASSRLFLLLAVLGGISLIIRRPAGTLWLLAWLLLPPLATLIALQAFPGYYVYLRFYIFMAPAYLLLVAEAVLWPARMFARPWPPGPANAGRRVWAGSVTLVVVAIFGWTWWATYQANLDNRWRDTARYLAVATSPADRIICEAYGRWGQIRAAHRDECFRELTVRLEEERIRRGLETVPALNLEIDEFATLQNIEAYRQLAFGPGGVWLVLWQADWPTRDVGMPATSAGVQATSIGANLLLESRARPTLVENALSVLEALLQVDNQPGDQFGYYLNLAQLYAAVGQPAAAEAALDEARRIAPEGVGAPERIQKVHDALQRVAEGG